MSTGKQVGIGDANESAIAEVDYHASAVACSEDRLKRCRGGAHVEPAAQGERRPRDRQAALSCLTGSANSRLHVEDHVCSKLDPRMTSPRTGAT